jgi:hypothetical protein
MSVRTLPNSKRLVRYWHVGLADYHYKLLEAAEIAGSYEETRSKGFLGLGGTETVTKHGKPDRYTSIVATGNEAWAERTAKHYGLEIEDEAS